MSRAGYSAASGSRAPLTTRAWSVSAAPALDARERDPAELSGDPRVGDEPPPGRAEEQPLVSAPPREQEPAAVRRPRDSVEVSGSGEYPSGPGMEAVGVEDQ